MSNSTQEKSDKVCVVVGVGEGLGAALALRFAAGYKWARQVVPEMLARGSGTILITGATAGIRPWPTSAGFAPAKFAVRGLAQVMSRDLHPQGIHVAYVNVDGGIDMPLLQKFRLSKDEDLLKPSAIADAFWYLAHQDRSAWS